MGEPESLSAESRGWPGFFGILVATLIGVGGLAVGPYFVLLSGPAAIVAGFMKSRRRAGSFAGGLFFGSLVWFPFDLAWTAAYYFFFSTLMDRP